MGSGSSHQVNHVDCRSAGQRWWEHRMSSKGGRYWASGVAWRPAAITGTWVYSTSHPLLNLFREKIKGNLGETVPRWDGFIIWRKGIQEVQRVDCGGSCDIPPGLTLQDWSTQSLQNDQECYLLRAQNWVPGVDPKQLPYPRSCSLLKGSPCPMGLIWRYKSPSPMAHFGTTLKSHPSSGTPTESAVLNTFLCPFQLYSLPCQCWSPHSSPTHILFCKVPTYNRDHVCLAHCLLYPQHLVLGQCHSRHSRNIGWISEQTSPYGKFL